MEKTGTNKQLLIIIPCFNEAPNISALHQQLTKLQIEGCSLHWIFVNDCSTDQTLNILKSENINHLDNPINLGIGGSVQLGLRYALEEGKDIAIQLDGDGQHPPSELGKLLLPLLNDSADVVIGSRFLESQTYRSTQLRRIGISFFSLLNRFLTGLTIKDATSGFRAYNKKAYTQLTCYYPDDFPEPEAIVYLHNRGLRIMEVAVNMREREFGKSSIGRLSSVYYMFKVSMNTLFLHVKLKWNGKL